MFQIIIVEVGNASTSRIVPFYWSEEIKFIENSFTILVHSVNNLSSKCWSNKTFNIEILLFLLSCCHFVVFRTTFWKDIQKIPIRKQIVVI